MPGGRPLKFETVKDLEKAIDAYFAECLAKEEPLTITGLALALDTSRKLLCEYEERPEFRNAIKKAKTKVENFAEKQLFSGRNSAGAIFALKNFDWSDKTQQELTGANGGPIQTRSLSDLDKEILEQYLKR